MFNDHEDELRADENNQEMQEKDSSDEQDQKILLERYLIQQHPTREAGNIKQDQDKQENENRYQQKPQRQGSDTQQTLDEQIAGYNVIGQDSTNQVIQINLYPKERIFVRGKIIYANFDYMSKSDDAGYQTFTEYWREVVVNDYPMRKVHNSKSHLVYFGLSRGGGKLLSIENELYGDDIYVNPGRVIMSNVNHANSKVRKHPTLRKFQNRLKVNEKNSTEKTLIVLQSCQNSIIIEKYLGSRQKFYCDERNVLALSGTVKTKSNGWWSPTKLQGPGWVFIQNQTNGWIKQNKSSIVGPMLSFIIMLMMLLYLELL